MPQHYSLDSIHPAAHIGTTDPSVDPDNNVRPGILWIDTTDDANIIKKRNATDDGWDELSVAGTGGGGTSKYINMVIDGGGADLTVGEKLVLALGPETDIVSWTLLGDAVGDLELALHISSYAEYITEDTTLISGSTEPPELVDANANNDSSLTGWTTNLAGGSILRLSVVSCTGITRATLALQVTQ